MLLFYTLNAGQKQISDTRKVQLLQATAAAARDSGYYVELIYATAREVRAQLLLQVRQKAIATAKERARAAGVEYKAPTILKKDIEPHLPEIPDKVKPSNHLSPLFKDTRRSIVNSSIFNRERYRNLRLAPPCNLCA